jgi:quinate dehydrogenase (quinone)
VHGLQQDRSRSTPTPAPKLWKYDPKATAPNWQRCRGLGYHDQDAGADASVAAAASAPAAATPAPSTTPAACRQRLLLPTTDARLIAVDAHTGAPCADFGKQGIVDLKTGMGEVKDPATTSRPPRRWSRATSWWWAAAWPTTFPPTSRPAWCAPTTPSPASWPGPGTRATPPSPSCRRPGRPTPAARPTCGRPCPTTPKLGLVYLPTGNATPDFWGGERTPLDDKYSSSVVALDATSGKVRWSFQTTHHDLWDFDLPAQPLLYDIPDGNGNGGTSRAGAGHQAGRDLPAEPRDRKADRRGEGTPGAAGQRAGRTLLADAALLGGHALIGNKTLAESDMWGATPFDQLLCRIAFKGMRHEGVYTPPGSTARCSSRARWAA